jgi:hypoxanthine phosphoribosyltransferase
VSDEREVLTYESFGTAARELAQQVADDGFEPDLVLSIARGGLFLGGALGYALDVKNLFVMNVEFYTGIDERLDLPVVLPPTLDAVDLTGAAVLVADDVADSGRTLELVRDFCAGYVSAVRTAVVYEKPRSAVKCDYVWRRTDAWIDFPWSSQPPIASAATARPTSRGPRGRDDGTVPPACDDRGRSNPRGGQLPRGRECRCPASRRHTRVPAAVPRGEVQPRSPRAPAGPVAASTTHRAARPGGRCAAPRAPPPHTRRGRPAPPGCRPCVMAVQAGPGLAACTRTPSADSWRPARPRCCSFHRLARA